MGRRASALAVALLVVAAMLGGCGDGSGDAGPAPTSGPGTSVPVTPAPGEPGTSVPATPAPAGTAASPTGPVGGGTSAGWTSGPVTVDRTVPVPPVPTLKGVRSAAHPGYDRITFDFVGTLPGYQVRYVDTVTQDGSGATVDMPGRRYLLITFQPAQAHTDSGDPVRPRRATFDHPMLRGYVISGDFEGVLNIALGLDDVVGFRVGEIPGTPGRVYVDVAA